MDGLVTSPAGDQRFAFPCRHQAKPGGNLFAPVAIEVSHLAEVVDDNDADAGFVTRRLDAEHDRRTHVATLRITSASVPLGW